MSLLSLIAVFLIEQFQPLNYRRVIETPLQAWADFIESRFNAGEYRHGVIGWCFAILLPTLLVAALQIALWQFNLLAALLFNILVLYLTMGFRQFSHHYTQIQLALRVGDLERAREVLASWRGMSTQNLDAREIARLTMETALLASHRHVFGVLFCYVVLGPCGAVLYRLSSVVTDRWQGIDVAQHNDFAAFSRQVFGMIEWLPARATAVAFAIVGDFEDAMHCWRTQAEAWGNRNLGIVLAAGAGALGVQLGMPFAEGVEVVDRAELGLGDPADVDVMQRAVGLVWRATLLWMLLLFLLGLASLAG